MFVCLLFFWLCSPNSIVSKAYTFSQYPRTCKPWCAFTVSLLLPPPQPSLLLPLPVRLPLFVYTSSSATFFVPLFLILPPFAHNANKPTRKGTERTAHIFKVVATNVKINEYACTECLCVYVCRCSGVSGFVSYHFVYNTSNET